MCKIDMLARFGRVLESVRKYKNGEIPYQDINLMEIVMVQCNAELRELLDNEMYVCDFDDALYLLDRLYKGFFLEYDALERIENTMKKITIILGGNL